MKIINAMKVGLYRSVKAWKGIIILWFISLIMVSLITGPFRAGVKAGFRNSMITEKLAEGINIDAIGDLGTNLISLVASLFSGIILLSITGILVGIFVSGGLFDALKRGSEKFSVQNFFNASSRNFWPFMIISFMLYLIVLFLIIFLVVVPFMIAVRPETVSELTVFRTLAVSGSLFLLAMTVVFLVADYSRAWQASQMKAEPFKSLGYGFRQTFRTFFSSFSLMIIIMFLQALVFCGLMALIAGFAPVTGGGTFMVLLLSQLLFIIKIFLKVLRFASIISLMEWYNAEKLHNTGYVKGDYPHFQDIPMELPPN